MGREVKSRFLRDDPGEAAFLFRIYLSVYAADFFIGIVSRFTLKKFIIVIYFTCVTDGGSYMQGEHIDHHSFFEQIYTFTPIGIGLLSMDGTVMKVNPALRKVLGYSEDELIGKALKDITLLKDWEANASRIEQLMKGMASSCEMEKRYTHKNGSLIWCSVHVSLVKDEVTGVPLYFIAHVIDISEKKAATELYQLISENAQEVIYCSTTDGICYYCSPSIEEMLGYKPEELIGKQNLDIIHPDDLEQLQSKKFADKEILRYRNRHKNGHYIWLETTFKIIDDEQGEPKVLAIARDITARKKNEDILSEAQRIASIGSWDWDIRASEVSFSDQVYLICNIDANQMIRHPRDLLRYVHASDQAFVKENMAEALKRPHFSLEFRNMAGDGPTRYLHLRGVVSFDEEDNPIRVNGTIQDITEQKEIELKLQEMVERYTSLKKYNHDAVISLDLEGTIIHGNSVAEQLIGYSFSELSGCNVSLLIGADHLKSILTYSLHDASIEHKINKLWHKDGHFVEVLTTIAPIIINSTKVGFYIIAKDITEQKKLLIAKEAAESTNKAKSEFLAMMSHEIRTPMNGVIGMTDLLLETTNLDAEQREYVEIISKSGETLLTIINDILDFSKIDSGKTELTEHPFHVKDCISETYDVLSSKAHEKCLEMTFSVSPDVPRTLIGDSERLKQVLMNLVGNAVKFTHSGGVSVSVRLLSREVNAVHLQFTVKDTGIGIPPDQINRLFEPFYQLDQFMTRKYDGTGLGLAISKKLVNLMDGDIWIEPTDGAGATFVFTVCLKEENHGPDPMSEQSIQEANKDRIALHILIAEDNEINQQVLKRMLEKQGHTVSVAKDGNQVIEQAIRQPHDIIFMDIHMPVMNGLDATKVIQEALPPEKCPVIVAVTANALKGDREQCLAAGMDDYMTKPIKIETVSDVIHKFFSK
jgi:PAS domain S-box-containing protein